MKTKFYMDYNATAPIRPAVIEAVAGAMASVGNPSSVHSAGREAKRALEEARVRIAALAGARPRDVVFTAGGTEATNMALRGSDAASLIISATEHDATIAAAKASGLPVFTVNVDVNGVLDLNHLKTCLTEAPAPALVSIMMANNEVGTVQDIVAISAIAKEHGARMHSDCVQAAGKMMLDLNALGCDYITLSAHKIGGPQGVGAVVMTPTAPLQALIPGGGQELGRRSGTENVAGAVGFGVAALEAMADIGRMGEIEVMRDRLETEIQAISDSIRILGQDAKRIPNTSCIAIPGVKGETQVMHFDLAGICVSSGSACSSGKVKVSHVLTAMGEGEDVAECAIRVSLGYGSTDADVDAFVAAYKKLYDRVGSRS